MNTGGIIGGNIPFDLTSCNVIWDISSLNSINFNLLVGADKQAVTYPLTS